MYQPTQNSRSCDQETGFPFPDQEADRCVMCGLCLPHCPTYRLTGDESESPRGRIALMRALASDQLAPTPRLIGHLDRCLTCRACEAVCPSDVPYGHLIDFGRAQVRNHRPRWQRIQRRLIQKWVIPHSAILRGLGRLARFAQITKIDVLLQRSGLLQALGGAPLGKLLPKLPPLRRWQRFYPARTTERGQVALFTGCIADVVDRPLLMATVQLLNQLGYGVHIPAEQVCCGALARHEGELEQAVKLASRNVKAFTALNPDAVICTASGCAASLIEYPQWVHEAEVMGVHDFAYKLRDINQFLGEIPWSAETALKPLAKRIAVHEPCSLRYVLHHQQAAYTLLGRIPGADVVPLADNSQCCGAAGSYMLTQPTLSQSLLADKINALQEIQPHILVTSNVGCALHLAAGVRGRNLPIEVLHPVQLLIRQLNLQ